MEKIRGKEWNRLEAIQMMESEDGKRVFGMGSVSSLPSPLHPSSQSHSNRFHLFFSFSVIFLNSWITINISSHFLYRDSNSRRRSTRTGRELFFLYTSFLCLNTNTQNSIISWIEIKNILKILLYLNGNHRNANNCCLFYVRKSEKNKQIGIDERNYDEWGMCVIMKRMWDPTRFKCRWPEEVRKEKMQG